MQVFYACRRADTNVDGVVAVNELVRAVRALIAGCSQD